jgi:hypothetical protein
LGFWAAAWISLFAAATSVVVTLTSAILSRPVKPGDVCLLDAREWLDARSVVGNTDCDLPVGLRL